MHVGDYGAVMRMLHGNNPSRAFEAAGREQKRRKEEATRVVWGPRKEALHRAMVDAFYAAGLSKTFPARPATEEERRLRAEYEAARAAWEQCPVGE